MKDAKGSKLKVGDRVAVSIFVKIGEARIDTGKIKSMDEDSAVVNVGRVSQLFYSESLLKLKDGN